MTDRTHGQKVRDGIIRKFGSWDNYLEHQSAKGKEGAEIMSFASNNKDSNGLTGKQRAKVAGKGGKNVVK